MDNSQLIKILGGTEVANQWRGNVVRLNGIIYGLVTSPDNPQVDTSTARQWRPLDVSVDVLRMLIIRGYTLILCRGRDKIDMNRVNDFQ